MRTAKDNSSVPTRYFRPPLRHCPQCGAPLKRHATVQDKVLTTLQGRFRLISLGYRCSRRRCAHARVTLVAPQPATLSLKGLSFGFDVIVQVGWGRFWEHRTLDEIWELARRRFPISRRQIMYLIVDFLCLLKAAQPARIEACRPLYQRRGLLLSIDALQPEKGNDALDVVRELRSGLTLHAAYLANQRADTIRARVLAPVHALGFQVRGIVSDAEEALHQACQQQWPGGSHHACHFHALREASKPLYEANRSLMVALKRDLRSQLRPLRRRIEGLAEEDPHRAVLREYAEALRSSLRVSSVAPFRLGGWRVIGDLRAVAASLRRCQRRGRTRSWTLWGLPRTCIAPPWRRGAAIAAHWGG